MFEAAELGARIPKEEYRARVPELRQSLLEAQQLLRSADDCRVIVLLGGLEAAGRSETANLLSQWMDPRWIVTRAWDLPSDEERERPRFWRYWRALPQRGRIGLFLDAWYGPSIHDRVTRVCGKDAFKSRLDRIRTFERALTDDGAVIVKFFFYLDAKSQRRRLKVLRADPLTRWRVTKRQWDALRHHDRVKEAGEQAIRVTSTDAAPWHIVEGADEHFRNVTVAMRVRDAILEGIQAAVMRATLERQASTKSSARRRSKATRVDEVLDGVSRDYNVLKALDLTNTLDKKRFRVQLEKQQGRLNRLQRQARARGVSTIAVFEGWDAAGKGGAVRRVTAALDAREYQVIPIAAPTDEELAHHYLWRFWRHLSRAGRVTIFDRSWYGRVLVERVEGLATSEQYRRGYGEINHFEEQLVDHGIVLTKFWLHVSKAEQLARFRDRKKTPHKSWKITKEDWRNRRRWDDYELAVNEMVARTSTRRAPWVLVEANDKNFARVKVIRTLADRLERALKR